MINQSSLPVSVDTSRSEAMSTSVSRMTSVAQKEDEEDFGDIPIEHLDYKYIDHCASAPELRRILRYLQSGKEGTWPDLEAACEHKMLQLMPARDRKLYLARTRGPSPAEVAAARNQLSSFVQEIQPQDEALRSARPSSSSSASVSVSAGQSDIFVEEAKEEESAVLPPIRNSGRKEEEGEEEGEGMVRDAEGGAVDNGVESSREKSAERLKGSDWEAWDKYDVEKELEAIEAKEERMALRAEEANSRKEKKARMTRSQRERHVEAIDVQGKPEAVRKFMGRAQKEKGNECFKAGEFEDAFCYYTAAIKYLQDLDPTPYTNRAAAALKLGRFEQAEEDCTCAIAIDGSFVKAYGRRGMARHKRGKYLDAISDFEHALTLEPSNKNLNNLLAESRKMYNSVGGIGADRPGAPAREKQTLKAERFTRLTIVEDDDESETDEVEESDDVHAVESQLEDEVEASPETESCVGDHKDTSSYTEDKEEVTTGGNDDGAGDARKDVDDWIEAKKLGAKLYSENKFKDALEWFEHGATLLKESKDVDDRVKCLGNCAACLKEMGDYEGVIRVCDSVFELHKDNIKAHMRKSLALEEIGKLDDALTSMCDVLRIDPDYTAAASGIERLMAKLNGTDSTSSSAKRKKSNASEQETVEGLKCQANEAFAAMKFAEAEELYTKCLALNETYTTAYANRAAARLKQSNYEGCVLDCTRGLQVRLEGEQKLENKLRYRRALANAELGAIEAALDDIILVQQQEPKNQRCQQLLKRLRALKRKQDAKLEPKPTTKPNAANAPDENKLPRQQPASNPVPPKNSAIAVAEERAKQQRAQLERLSAQGQERVAQALKANKLATPRSFLDFERTWKQLNGMNEEKGLLVMQLSDASLRRIFKVEIPEDILMDIFKAFSLEKVREGREQTILRILKTLTTLKRFKTTVAFLTKDQQRLIRDVLESVHASATLVANYL